MNQNEQLKAGFRYKNNMIKTDLGRRVGFWEVTGEEEVNPEELIEKEPLTIILSARLGYAPPKDI